MPMNTLAFPLHRLAADTGIEPSRVQFLLQEFAESLPTDKGLYDQRVVDLLRQIHQWFFIDHRTVEAIRREITERNTKLIAANVAVLTPAQVVKLKALEEAMKLVVMSSQAQSLKLLPDACSLPTLAIRGGDFAPAPARVIFDPVAGGLGYSIFGSSCAPQLTIGGIFVP